MKLNSVYVNFQDLWNKFFLFIFGQLCDKKTFAFVVMGIGKKTCVGWRWDGQRSLGRQCPFCWCVCVCVFVGWRVGWVWHNQVSNIALLRSFPLL